MMRPLATPTLSEAVTLIGSVPLTVAPDAGLTIEVVGALVSVPPVGAGVGPGVGAGAGDVVPPEGGGAFAPACAALSASKSTPTSLPSEALPLNGLVDESL